MRVRDTIAAESVFGQGENFRKREKVGWLGDAIMACKAAIYGGAGMCNVGAGDCREGVRGLPVWSTLCAHVGHKYIGSCEIKVDTLR